MQNDKTKNTTREEVVFRAKLWRAFVAEYQAVLDASTNEEWADYCAKFRVRWIAGK